MSKVAQIPFIYHFYWWLTGSTFWCSSLKIDEKQHHYDQIMKRRCLWSLKQMFSPANDSCTSKLSDDWEKLTYIWREQIGSSLLLMDKKAQKFSLPANANLGRIMTMRIMEMNIWLLELLCVLNIQIFDFNIIGNVQNFVWSHKNGFKE